VAAKYPMGIVSGAEREEIEYVLVRAGIRDCFQTIITSADLNSGKPDPEGYLKLLATLNSLNNFAPPILPEECLVIEDSRAGVQAAKNAGMRCLAVTNSYPAEQLAQANWIVAGLEDCDPASLWES
ncbi:MAG TPA: HAD family phosphatase, partial [Blastocatellia bacterium]|nr:HAD family phosphatase [Blastocatellia bacterium]